jgi:hypothetical protein
MRLATDSGGGIGASSISSVVGARLQETPMLVVVKLREDVMAIWRDDGNPSAYKIALTSCVQTCSSVRSGKRKKGLGAMM